MNPYLKNCKYAKKSEDQLGGDYFEEGGWGDALTPDWLETPAQFYTKKITAPIIRDDGSISAAAIINKNPAGLMATTAVDFFSELWDYSDTREAVASQTQDAWAYKAGIAKKLKKAQLWPSNISKKFSNTSKAIPNVNLSVVLGVPPNSVADAYAQGAIFAYLTAKMYNKPEFIKLGDAFLQKAVNSPNSIKEPEVKINLDDPIGTIKSFAKADKVVGAMKDIRKAWRKVAAKTDIYPAWYNIPGQLSREWDGASEIDKRLELFSHPEEINFSRSIAEQSQGSFYDLLLLMRAPIIIAGVAIAGVVLAPVIGPLLPTIGRGAVSVGKGVGRLASSTVKLIGTSAKSGIQNAVKQGITDSKAIEEIVTSELKSQNQDVSEEDIRNIIKQELRSLK